MAGKGESETRDWVPNLKTDYAGVERGLRWLWKATAKGVVDPQQAQAMTAVAKAMLSSLRQSDERSIQERIAKLKEEFADMKRMGLAHIAKSRVRQDEEADGEPH